MGAQIRIKFLYDFLTNIPEKKKKKLKLTDPLPFSEYQHLYS